MATVVRKAQSESGSSEYEESSASEEEETKSKVGVVRSEAPKMPQEEEEEESDTDSDSEPGERSENVKRDANSGVPIVQAAKGAVVVAPEHPAGKRGRDVNGGKGVSSDEPANKKRKEVKDERPRPPAAGKPVSPARGDKGGKPEPAVKAATKGAVVAKAEKAKPAASGKAELVKPGPARKRKGSPQPVNSTRQQPSKAEGDKSSPLKPKKTATWTSALEVALVGQLLADKARGLGIPVTKTDSYWESLLRRLPLEDEMSALQACEKVRRMKTRHMTLKTRVKEEGVKLFKSVHEEKLFLLWEKLWGSGTEPFGRGAKSQPATEEEGSDSESAGTGSRPGEITKTVGGQFKGEDSSSEDDNGEDEETENVKRKTAGLNEINAAKGDGKPRSETKGPGLSPFISKPLLGFTPLHPKDDKRKGLKKTDDSGDQHTGDVLAGDDGRRADVSSLTSEVMKQLRSEVAVVLQEIRANCFQYFDEVRGDRFGSLSGGAGQLSFGSGFGSLGMMEGLGSGNGSQATVELKKKWRAHKVRELALLSDRLQLLQEQCRLQQEELKLEYQKLEPQEMLT